ncbi:MAG: hypothetical protein J6R89_07305, partial [Clostridia bacterium]|nr:hypothetical protein [Clostridia bacterium]
MRTVTDCIREDREYAQLLEGVRAAFRATKPLPLAVNGLCDGAAEALYVSLTRDVLAERGGVALVICADEKECVKTASLFGRFGL